MSSLAMELTRLAEMKAGPRRDKLTLLLADTLVIPSVARGDAAEPLSGLLSSLVVVAARELRVRVAGKLAVAPAAPRELVLSLALDEFEVAEPIIEQCRVLLEEDLLVIAQQGTARHRCALAGRADVSSRVCDAIAKLAEPTVLAALLRNAGAPLSEWALKTCIDAAPAHEALQELLALRDGLPRDLVEAVYLIVGADLRRQITERYTIDEAPLRRIIEATAAQAKSSADRAAEHDAETAALVRTLHKSNALSAHFIIRSVAEGRREIFVHAAGLQLDADADAIKIVF